MKKEARILVIDNYDSFVFNLVQYFHELGAKTTVVRNDAINPAQVGEFDGVLISPGPGAPEDAGVSVAVVHECAAQSIPLLGVCLGHQAIAIAYGARVSSAPTLLHGMTSEVIHNQSGIYAGIPSPFTATRYHSLAVEKVCFPEEIEITGESDGVIMSLAHRDKAIYGVQFHPESVLTEHGHKLMANWLNLIY